MRAKISIRKTTPEPMHYDYQYWLASMLLNRLNNAKEELADFLHANEGYRYYTFSNIIIEEKKRTTKKGIRFERGHFYITALDPDFIEGFVKGLLQEPNFNLGKSEFLVEEVYILERKQIPEICTMKTLSPVYVKTKRLTKDGELMEWDLHPKNGKFHENIHKNLVSRYKERYGKKPKEDHFEIIEILQQKERRYKIKGSYRRCTEMKFKVQGSRELLNLAYNAGLGEKNAMGFGCVGVVR